MKITKNIFLYFLWIFLFLFVMTSNGLFNNGRIGSAVSPNGVTSTPGLPFQLSSPSDELMVTIGYSSVIELDVIDFTPTTDTLP